MFAKESVNVTFLAFVIGSFLNWNTFVAIFFKIENCVIVFCNGWFVLWSPNVRVDTDKSTTNAFMFVFEIFEHRKQQEKNNNVKNEKDFVLFDKRNYFFQFFYALKRIDRVCENLVDSTGFEPANYRKWIYNPLLPSSIEDVAALELSMYKIFYTSYGIKSSENSTFSIFLHKKHCWNSCNVFTNVAMESMPSIMNSFTIIIRWTTTTWRTWFLNRKLDSVADVHYQLRIN